MQVTAGCGRTGNIAGTFGKSGKFRVSFPDGLTSTQELSDSDKALTLIFKRFVFDRDKRHMAQ